MNSQERIPVTVITGFLGSGKTTLLNYILDQNKQGKNLRLAVIENEFAAAFGIENEILHHDKTEDIQHLYEFGMGCVCCSSSGELINALVEIAMRNLEEPKEKRIQHVILETTGLADPTPILQLITQGADRKGTDDIVQNYYVNQIITLLDTKHFYQHYLNASTDYKNELLAQILTTDTIILNKIDLLDNSTQDLETIQQLIQTHNPTANLFMTSFAQVPMDIILNARSQQPIQPNALQEAAKTHDPSIEQTMVLAPGYVDLEATQQFIKDVTCQGHIYRVKGVLALKTKPDTKFNMDYGNQKKQKKVE
ncbi:CobW/HypB/UreG, nucleotide-binding domain-containing protein [Gilbertella persicaria]|uniref:CobW/HypB/UreG, nucleotide-binding domain-containing protein n=1 Tax=Gilbertella persicaria TaxID=101096 RepID=UPI00221EEA6E|nr:CobW/HypB/UreG, nucleotide-binding domain-containing protein [Gilbertella persicaria]KAI8091441.1 CobW/HypB/UreG, nucleotide-binding domain-containing protein [Gilbertella persicaria]